MPELGMIEKANRLNKALEVLMILQANPKTSQKDACKQIGIDPKTYRAWITQAQDAVLEMQRAKIELERSELAAILIAREQILQMTIRDGLKAVTDPLTRLTILNYLDRRTDELAARHRATDPGQVRDLLSGPKQVPAESRFAPGTETLEVVPSEDGQTVTVRVKAPEVLDGDAHDTDPGRLAFQ